MSFDVILPFLRPIESLLKDPSVSEIMVNGPSCVFIERDGRLEDRGRVFPSPRNLSRLPSATSPARSAMRSAKRSLCLIRGFPMAHAWRRSIPPCSVGGTTLTIRKFHSRFLAAEELVRTGTLSQALLDCFRRCSGTAKEYPDQRGNEQWKNDFADRARGIHLRSGPQSS